jgi:hypothetical protein
LSLAVKACSYAIEYILSCDGDDNRDNLKFVYINELVCEYFRVASGTFAYSIADVVHALVAIFPGPVGDEYWRGISDIRALLKSLGMHEYGRRGFQACGVAPTLPSLKHWLAAGLPILAGITIPEDWDRGREYDEHRVRQGQSFAPCFDATVIVVVGWDDRDQSFQCIRMDADRGSEDAESSVGYFDVIGQDSRIELVAVTQF